MASKHGSKKKRDKAYVKKYDGRQLSVMFSKQASVETEITPRTTFETIKAGQAERGEIQRMVYLCDITRNLTAHFNEKEEMMKTIVAGLTACANILERAKTTGRFVGSGDDIRALEAAINLYDQAKATVSRREFAIALAKEYRGSK